MSRSQEPHGAELSAEVAVGGISLGQLWFWLCHSEQGSVELAVTQKDSGEGWEIFISLEESEEGGNQSLEMAPLVLCALTPAQETDRWGG